MTDTIPKRRWVSRLDRLTPTPVPFALAPARRGNEVQWFEERASPRVWALFAIVPGFFALFLIAMPVVGMPARDIAVMAGCVLVLGGLAGFMIAASGWYRRLVVEGRTDIVRLLECRRNGKVRREVARPLSECALLSHPVRLVIMTSRIGSPVLHWEGHAAVVHVGGDRFVLAVLKRRAELDAYRAGLPNWLRLIDSGDGPLIEASANKRVF